MYVQLWVMLDEDAQPEPDDDFHDSGPINTKTALECYQRLVVGDPGSGKSTFLYRYTGEYDSSLSTTAVLL